MVAAVALVGCSSVPPPLPDQHGFAGSVSGVVGGALFVGGGANFPDRKPWEGGTKVWHDTLFVLQSGDRDWNVMGKLPRPIGYAVCFDDDAGGMIYAGGSDAAGHSADVVRMRREGRRLVYESLPPLPATIANACGTRVGGALYVVGGIDSPNATAALSSVYRLDLAKPQDGWRAMPPLPGDGRMLAVAAAVGESLYVVGGVALRAGPDGKPSRRYLSDGYCLDPGGQWRRLPDLPRPVAAAPSPAPADGRAFYILGGDDGSQVGLSPDLHRGFRRDVLRYDVASAQWSEAGTLDHAHVTTPTARWRDRWYVPGGEVRPGIRSPEVWTFTPPAAH
jgi:N-acetylneuraminic acid mutarotase